MFNTNKYSKWYFNIVENARNKVLETKGELHHIIPRCMGGSDDTNNLILLSLREHYIVHLLLVKMVDAGQTQHKLMHAFKMMATTRKVTSRIYEIYKLKYFKTKYDYIYNPNIQEVKLLFDGEIMPPGYEYGSGPKSEEWKAKNRKPKPKGFGGHLSEQNKGAKHWLNHITFERKFSKIKPEGDDWYILAKEKEYTNKDIGRKKLSEKRKGQRPYYDPITTHTILLRDVEDIPAGYIKGRLHNPHTNHKQTENQKQKARDANTKMFEIIMTNGERVEVKGRDGVCMFLNVTNSHWGYMKRINKLYTINVQSISQI